MGADDAAPPPPAAAPPTGAKLRDELVAAPPFLTWRAIYAIVLGALAIEIALFAVLTAALR